MDLHISENIRRLRKDRRMTQEQLAEALGITVGAVYKWENGLAMPEIRLLVELADLFEVSVDYLLGYEVYERGVDTSVERIWSLVKQRRHKESVQEAEKALQKYPNDFNIIYYSAQAYFLLITQDKKAAERCIELLERACLLFEQNTNKNITLRELRESIASCYIGLKQYDKCVELLKDLNSDGSQDPMIGMVLAHYCRRAEDALPYLTGGLYGNLTPLARSVLGFSKAYTLLGQYDNAYNVVQWMIDTVNGLRDSDALSFWDKVEAVFLTLLSDSALRMGDKETAYRHLREARDIAQRFDAAPDYRTHVGLKFYHCGTDNYSLDDMGDTALLAIENTLERDACDETKMIWKEIKDET